jgi:hypothetical protein
MTIDMITVRWDDRPDAEPGWYCEIYSNGVFVDDSTTPGFPVAVGAFGRDREGELARALLAAFPDATIRLPDTPIRLN